MQDAIIQVENLTKIYKLYDSPVARFKESLDPIRRKYHHDFYALKNVTFDVKKGESIGIIGKNGSGKSTLLKILTGVLTPTSGKVSVGGKISALLELGAGFNPELSGIENIYFNGMLMGYTREEMDERLDDILAFADISEFVLQPVKTYSSGMFVRLAFAVAVNVDPDILIIDEALSVGDALFQQRCIARIRAMRESGLTLLFVSHTPDVIRALCDTAIWLEGGCIKIIKEAVKVSNAYQHEIFLENNRLKSGQYLHKDSSCNMQKLDAAIVEKASKNITTSESIHIHHVNVINNSGELVDELCHGEDFEIEVQLSSGIYIPSLSVGILIKDRLGIDLTGESNFNKFRKGIALEYGQVATVSFRSKMLLSGGQTYTIALSLNSVSRWDRGDNILLYRDDAAAAFKVIADMDRPLWFKFYQEFGVHIDVE
ncbi:ABC transporter ATP-binding protein [Geobacter sp. DSM 9736]|uniref:ABC transporter ATP-binding protein n=1 Tax=Geobacter sp. DSM 9736 TaxID=1277350 RepID=UPI000B50517F|nr:ABC transporter ATP-binding protein [Geobacter sp. DSM 9736]SNB46631.1 lipopolysaccharide transport system ATP-binding protein/teichoic acid transport system ATP-binding protein [Geobacter sp. DSM 9736]